MQLSSKKNELEDNMVKAKRTIKYFLNTDAIDGETCNFIVLSNISLLSRGSVRVS